MKKHHQAEEKFCLVMRYSIQIDHKEVTDTLKKIGFDDGVCTTGVFCPAAEDFTHQLCLARPKAGQYTGEMDFSEVSFCPLFLLYMTFRMLCMGRQCRSCRSVFRCVFLRSSVLSSGVCAGRFHWPFSAIDDCRYSVTLIPVQVWKARKKEFSS